ncbi:3-oxoadipate enol-lactonase [Saccharothrix tamanrassetensis]|uniref:3-oxoadipate enol-lactonase n=1 Tax=Saccharothrix tamanrassetensis TaxID=1051531 RepID=A0A841C5P3_9PSEU|nr:alpha/beta fold hydrolase [Saccharothrix tamanrassetensis]MBB5953852.1 3-oxoadipate enol-lactonase [Saccharothrix tamanrassetensis]
MEHIDLDGGGIGYRLRGNGPPLVLLATLAGSWMRQLPALSQHFTILTYDMRGFGDSPSDTGFPTNAQHADDLAALLDHLDIDRAVVIGMSHGGLVAQHFAAKHTDRLSGLGLVATFAAPHGPTQLLLRMLNGFLERDDLPGFWEVLKSMLFSAAGAPAMLRREAALRRAMFDQYDVAALSSIYTQALEHDSRTWLAGLRCPTLVVGGAEDILFPPVLTEGLAGLVPGARTELLPAAHIPPVEAPQQFNELVVEVFGGTRS